MFDRDTTKLVLGLTIVIVLFLSGIAVLPATINQAIQLIQEVQNVRQ